MAKTVWVVVTEDCGILDDCRVFENEADARANFREIANDLEPLEVNEYAAWNDDFTVAIYEREVE